MIIFRFMKKVKRMLYWLIGILGVLGLIMLLAYNFQEKLIFFPEKLPEDQAFSFRGDYEERWIPVEEGVRLHGLHFRSDSAKGLVFYLHGNAGSMAGWGGVGPIYTRLGYDVFILDYRGFGKSEGKIKNEEQFHQDIQIAYDELKAEYAESNIVIVGYSVGSGPAANLAANNSPGYLILQAPYYSLTDLTKNIYPFVPGFLLKYKFPTCDYVEKVNAPITVFHGYEDEVIYYGSSVKLKRHLKPTDELITLNGQAHNGMNENPTYQQALQERL